MTTTNALTEIVITVESTSAVNPYTGEPVQQRVAYLNHKAACEGIAAHTSNGFRVVGLEERPRKTYANRQG